MATYRLNSWLHLYATVVALLLGCSGGYTLTAISAIIFCINSSFTDIPVLYFVFFLCVCVFLWRRRDRQKFCFLYVFLRRSVFSVDSYYYLINEFEIKLDGKCDEKTFFVKNKNLPVLSLFVLFCFTTFTDKNMSNVFYK